MKKKMNLETELRYAIEDAVVGEIMRPGLSGRIKTIARAILIRHRLPQSKVVVSQVGSGFEVTVWVQSPGARVREIRLNFGAL